MTTTSSSDSTVAGRRRPDRPGGPMAAAVRHLTSQFGRPRGLLGVVAGRIMSKRGSNVDRNLWLVDRAEIEADHRLLELGPGPGVALVAAARAATRGEVYGVDHSATMLRMAARRVRRAGVADRVTLLAGRAQVLHHDLRHFDRIYCMNVW
ncbi:MAG: class I SAM-dependent methyltransferase, partial [Actinomycetota bacterium]